jgi:hypothetical protein
MSAPGQITPHYAGSDAGRPEIMRAIESATQRSHTPFATLVAIAGAESGFRADAQSHSSSAAGPFQITEGTWLHLVKSYGAAAGRPDLAALVQRDANGELSVAPANRAAVLGARHDIELSSQLAARFCDECRNGLAKKLGRPPTEEDVRLAYFLGVNGATRLMKAAELRPGEAVRSILPGAFANHRGMFSHHGRPLDAAQAFTSLESRFSTQIAQSSAVKSYAGANALADTAGFDSNSVELASADAAAEVFAAAANGANTPAAPPATVVVASATDTTAVDAQRSPALAQAPAPDAPAPPPPAIPLKTASADSEKTLACTPSADGGVTCAL